MTKVRFKGPIGGFSGAMDGIVFADHGERTVAYIRKERKGEKSEAEQNWDRQWDEAQAYARSVKADPEKWEFYKLVGKEKKCPPYALAVGDYLNAPTFDPLDLQYYQGQVGNPIKIRAFDDVGLVSVAVSIYLADGTGIEEGMAVEMGARSGFWTYTTTQPVTPGTSVSIEVTGVDHTGKWVRLTENPVVGGD